MWVTKNADLAFDSFRINSSLSSENRHAEMKIPNVGFSSCIIILSVAVENRKFEFQMNGKNVPLIVWNEHNINQFIQVCQDCLFSVVLTVFL